MATRRQFAVAAPGLGALRRDLRRIDRELRLAADHHLRALGNVVREKSRQRLRERSKNPQGRIERTIRTSVTRKGVSIYSNHPGAGVIHWGGTISPRGTPIEIEPKRFIDSVAEEEMESTVEELGGLLDGIANRAGFIGP